MCILKMCVLSPSKIHATKCATKQENKYQEASTNFHVNLLEKYLNEPLAEYLTASAMKSATSYFSVDISASALLRAKACAQSILQH
jgi:hypothetical protein